MENLPNVKETLPNAEEPNKFLAVVKLLGSSALMVGIGAVIYWVGKSRNRSAYNRR